MELKNRIVMTAMHMAYTTDGEVTGRLIGFYGLRASGGVGLIIVGGCPVDEYGGMTSMIGIHDDRFIPGLKRLTGAVKQNGARICAQLYQAGRYTHSSMIGGEKPISSSAVRSRFTGETPRALDPEEIPVEWINSAKENLWIGYGHTSHGGQLTAGMNAIEEYYTDGTFDWSHSGGPGQLHLCEGSGYNTGYVKGDLGTTYWADETREYLDDFPECNVIIWAWCGQVNNVVLQSHYLGPMEQLESEYPDVQFVYMTGHLEGEGIGGSLQLANEQIRNYCIANNKILFDFADIEKYSPDADTNFQEYYANDACDYDHPSGGTANWANDWLAANPSHELTQISQLCSTCAHSVSLNCTKKRDSLLVSLGQVGRMEWIYCAYFELHFTGYYARL